MRLSRSHFSLLVVGALTAVAWSVVAQSPAPAAGNVTVPPSQGAAPAQQPPAPGAPAGQAGRGGRGGSTYEPDFSKKPPVLPLTPAEEAKRLWLPPGFR